MITTNWMDTNQTIVLWEFPEKYDREAFVAAEKASAKLMAESKSAVIDIVMLTNRSDLDGTSNIIDSLVTMMQRLPDEAGLVVLVVPPMVARIMRTTWNTISGGETRNQLQFVTSLEEARMLVTQMRAVA